MSAQLNNNVSRAAHLSLFVLAMALSMTNNAVSQNLLTNPGFEQGSAGWSPSWYPSQAGFTATTTSAHSGTLGLWMYTAPGYPSFSAVYQDVPASSCNTYEASAFLRSNQSWVPGSRAYVMISFLNANNQYLGSYTSDTLLSGGMPFAQFSVTAKAIHPSTVKVRFMVRLENPSSLNQSILNADECSLMLNATSSGPVVSATVTNVKFNGLSNGSISTSVSGSGPFVYLWSTGSSMSYINGLPAGTYTCTVTDNGGCKGIVTSIISQPAQIAFSLASNNVSCFGYDDGEILVANISGGVPPYSYSWSNGQSGQQVTGLGPGSYSVTVSDSNACTKTASATIQQPSGFTLNYYVTPVDCYSNASGSVTVFTGGGTPPYTYSWSSGGTGMSIFNVQAGTYGFTVTDSHLCSDSAYYSVPQPDSIHVTAVIGNSGGNNGFINLLVIGGTPGYLYQWNTGATAANISGLAPGNYTVTITDAHNCVKVKNFNVGNTMGIDDEVGSMAAYLDVYPNPCISSLVLNYKLFESGNMSLDLNDVLGNQMIILASGELPAGDYTQNLDLRIPTGVYLVNLRGKNFRITKRLLVISDY